MDPIANQMNNRPRKTVMVGRYFSGLNPPTLYNFFGFLMRTNLSICIFLLLLFNVSPAYSYKILTDASPPDKLKLPKFCWAQARVPGAVGAEFTINNCPGANHYCVGLLQIEYAKKESNTPQKRNALLKDALKHIRYTELRTSSRPKCEIHTHVVAKRIEVENLLKIYGVEPGK